MRYKISSTGRVKIAVLATLMFFSSIVLDAWKADGFDSATVVYFYSTPPGRLLLWLRFVALLWFVYCCQTTMKAFDTKVRARQLTFSFVPPQPP